MLTVEPGQSNFIKMGVSETAAKEKFQSLIDLFTMYPTEFKIHNQTKTCIVTIHTDGSNVFHITVTNPKDEIFKL